MRDIASSLGFESTINYGPDLQMWPQIKFVMACDSGNLRRIKALVESLDEDDRESLESARMEGLGALHAAAMKGNVDVCRYLVEVLKFDINSVSSPELGMTPLISAASEGQIAVVRYLLEKDANPNKQDHEGYAPLHDAAKGGFDEISRLLLSGGAIVDISSAEGTPLHVAAAFGKIGVMQILLEHHADVNKLSPRDWTPLAETLLAAPERVNESTCLKCMKLLAKAGADLNSRHPQTPLVIATLRGLTECAENLLKAGADANIPANDVGSRPIEIAAESGSRKLVEILFPFTSPIPDVSNWSIEGIIAHAKSIVSKGKANQSENKDSKVDLKLHDEKVNKQDAVSSKPCPEDISDKDRKAQLKLQGAEAVEGKDYTGELKFYSEYSTRSENEYWTKILYQYYKGTLVNGYKEWELMKGIRMYEFKLKGCQEDKVLCKVIIDELSHDDSNRQKSPARKNKRLKLKADEKGKVTDCQSPQEIEKLHTLQENLKRVEEGCKAKVEKISELEKTVKALVVEILERQQSISKKLQLDKYCKRKEAQISKLEKLQGNIRVFCRVKPPLVEGEPLFTISYPESVPYLGRGISIAIDEKRLKESFTFDKVFDQCATQTDVFQELQLLVESAITGNEHYVRRRFKKRKPQAASPAAE
nr:unnamed protein product [Digitaria exilis]